MPPKGKGKAKGKQTHRKTTASASNPIAARIFPTEVLFSILSRLPAKSLLRFKCVCKHWRTLTSLQKFISEHLRRSPASLLIHAYRTPYIREEETHPRPPLRPDGHAIYAYGPPNPQSSARSTIVRIPDFPGSDVVGFDRLEVFGSTPNGIVCICQKPYAETFTLWNPATRSSLRIPATPNLKPNPNIHRGVSVGLGFDPSCNEFKIIRIICHSLEILMPDAVEIYSHKSGRWRLLESHEIAKFCVLKEKCEAVVNGVPYWRAVVNDRDLGVRPMLVSFDAKRVEFDLEPFAWALPENIAMCIGEFKGFLGAVVWDYQRNDILDVWVKENEFSGWSRIYRVGPLPMLGKVVGFYGDRGIVHEVGEEGTLVMFDLENMEIVEDFVNFENAVPGTFRLVSYRESLNRIPAAGSSIIWS